MNKNKIPFEEIEKLINAVEHDKEIHKELLDNNELSGNGYHPKMRQVHEDNLALLKSFLNKYGWPRPSLNGSKVFESAWLISIHAIAHPKHLINTLKEIKKMLDLGEEVAYQYACLYDRVCLFTEKKQKYGTQFWPSVNGWYLRDLDGDEETIDKNRAEIGLPSIKEKWQEVHMNGRADI